MQLLLMLYVDLQGYFGIALKLFEYLCNQHKYMDVSSVQFFPL